MRLRRTFCVLLRLLIDHWVSVGGQRFHFLSCLLELTLCATGLAFPMNPRLWIFSDEQVLSLAKTSPSGATTLWTFGLGA